MTPTPERRRMLPRVGPPALRAAVTFEPAAPPDGPVTAVPLIHVRRPLVRGKLVFEPVSDESTGRRYSLELELPVAGPEGEAVARVEALIAGLSAAELALGGAGLTRNHARSSQTPGTLTLVLDPTNPDGAERRLNAIALIVQAGTGFAGLPVPVRVRNGVAA